MQKDFLSEGKSAGVLSFENNKQRYKKLIDDRVNGGDLLGALSFAFSSLKVEFDLETLADIANIYADMECYELSNKYWFIYLDKAPKDKSGLAYEELAINFFYMNNVGLATYYFHRKITVDGFISQENLDPEIAEFFSGQTNIKSHYKLVYPIERADFSNNLKDAKLALGFGDYKGAVKILKEVPNGCKQYKDALGDLSIAQFLSGDEEGATDSLREYIKVFGEDAFALCNLSSMYNYKGDKDKAKYFYEKAVALDVDDDTVILKLATNSLEQGEHKRACEYFARFFKEQSFDFNLVFLYGLALANSFDYEKALEVMSRAYKIDPDNLVAKYYIGLIKRLILGDKKASKLLPFLYIPELPEKEIEERIEYLKKLSTYPQDKISNEIKKEDTKDILRYALRCKEQKMVNACIKILDRISNNNFEDIILEALIHQDVSTRLKEKLCYFLIVSGFTNKISMSTSQFFVKFRPRKMPSSKDNEGFIFFKAYALAVARVSCFGETDLDKLAFGSDKVYKRLRDSANLSIYTKEELASLTVYLSELKLFRRTEDASKLFEVKSQRFEQILSEYKGDKDDKNN